MQFNTVNAFVYKNLDKIVFIQMFFIYDKNGKVLCLNKALYGL